MGLGKDGLSNSVGDVVPNVGSPLQAACPVLPRGDTEILMKVIILSIRHYGISYGFWCIFCFFVFL